MIDRLGTIHLGRPQFGGGKGSNFIEIFRQTIVKRLQVGRGQSKICKRPK